MFVLGVEGSGKAAPSQENFWNSPNPKRETKVRVLVNEIQQVHIEYVKMLITINYGAAVLSRRWDGEESAQ